MRRLAFLAVWSASLDPVDAFASLPPFSRGILQRPPVIAVSRATEILPEDLFFLYPVDEEETHFVPRHMENKDIFVNNNPWSWLNSCLDLFGVKESKPIVVGPFTFFPNFESFRPTLPEEAASLVQAATDALTSISDQERERRAMASKAMWGATAMYVVWASLFADDGGMMGHFVRFGAVVPGVLARGYQLTGETGFRNIAQGGFWDIDGSVFSNIEDPKTARAILDKINDLNYQTMSQAASVAGLFGLLPESVSSGLVSCSLFFGVLYALRDYPFSCQGENEEMTTA